MSDKLKDLIAKLGETEEYTALSDADIQKQAQQRYQSMYDQKRLNAQQAYESSDAALARELSGLQASYDRQRAQSKASTKQTYAQADRQALSRGMQRSSYNSATLANIDLAGDAALRDIGEKQTAHEKEIGEKRTQLVSELSGQLRQYDTDQMHDQLSYQDELKAREYDRAAASRNERNELYMKIYEYQHQLEKEAEERRRWKAEFEAKYSDTNRR